MEPATPHTPQPGAPANALSPAASGLLAAAALVGAGLSVVFPLIALPAVVLVVLVAVVTSDRRRVLVAVGGGVLVTASMVRFTVEIAVPRLVSSGQHAAEERAVSRLREILWAEENVRAKKWIDADRDGAPEYGLLGELTGAATPRPGVKLAVPLLESANFTRDDAPAPAGAVYQSDGYNFIVYLPTRDGRGAGEGPASAARIDPKGASIRFVAYAWPAAIHHGGQRAFLIDQDNHICQTPNTQGYTGTAKIPAPEAGYRGDSLESPVCAGTGRDGGRWFPWKKHGLQMNR